MTRQRILHVELNRDRTIGGSYFSLLYLVEGLDKAVWEPAVVFHQLHRLVPQFERVGARVMILEPPSTLKIQDSAVGRALQRAGRAGAILLTTLSPVQKAWNFTVSQTRTVLLLRRFLRRAGTGLVHLNSGIELNHEWMLAARLCGIPCISHERWIADSFRAETRWIARHCLRAIVCISDAVRDNMAAQGIRGPRLVRIHNGLDPAKVRAGSEKPPADEWGAVWRRRAGG